MGVSLAGLVVERVGTAAVIAVGAIGLLGAALNFGRLRARHRPADTGS